MLTTTGFRYWLTFIDNVSCYCWVVALCKESNTFYAFQQFKAYIETQYNGVICIFRQDKGRCLVSDGVPQSVDALIAKGLSCVYETEEHLSFNEAMEHAFAVVASKQSPELVEPKLFKQAMSGPNADKWYEACMAEMQAHFENGTWQLVQLPAGQKAIGSKWVFKIKRNADSSVEQFKACLVAQGFSQRPGVDFTETFVPTTK
jgi:hypothetical protein